MSGQIPPPLRAKNPPELYPFADFVDVPTGTRRTILKLTGFGKPATRFAYLVDVATRALAGVNLAVNARGGEGAQLATSAYPGLDKSVRIQRLADTQLEISVINSSGTDQSGDSPNPAWQSRFAILYTVPTVLEKLVFGITLTSKEKEIEAMFGLDNLLQQGLVRPPNPLNSVSLSSYSPIETKTVSGRVTIDTAGDLNAVSLGERINVGEQEWIALHFMRVDGQFGEPSDGITLRIIRDGVDTIDFDNFCLPVQSEGFDLWIPALESLEVFLFSTVVPQANYDFLYNYSRLPLTVVELARWFPKESISFQTPAQEAAFDVVRAQLIAGLPIVVPTNGVPASAGG